MPPEPYGFRRYRPTETAVPVTCVTPNDGLYIHTFYDICPFSPSGRYLAVTRLPFQDREPRLGETADVCVIDLIEQTIETVYTTQAWGLQLGANAQWGTSDRYLYTNEMRQGEAGCTEIDLETGTIRRFAGPMYHIAPDGGAVIGVPPKYLNATQPGYGVPRTATLPPGAARDEGLWRTDLATDRRELLMSIAKLVKYGRKPSGAEGGTYYFFHSKFSPQGARISQVVRCMTPNQPGWHPQLLTFEYDGQGVIKGRVWQAVTPTQWAPGGHHPNWHPDGERIIMNLKPDGETLRFCEFRYDGANFRVLSERHLGSGHPSVEPGGRFLITDCYVGEPMTLENGEVPLRLLDLAVDEALNLCAIDTLGLQGVLRVDPHPAWSRDYRRVCFNGTLAGKRQVFIADLTPLVG